MKKSIKPSMTWEEAPDTITPYELGKILGIGEPSARAKFDEKSFPRILGLGALRKADKQAARLYLQGINIKTNQKEAIAGLLLFELRQLNNNLKEKRINNKNIKSDTDTKWTKNMEDTELESVKTITPYEAGKLLRMNAGTVRAGLRQGRFSFGTAIPPEEGSGHWTYNIIKSKVLEYAGISSVKEEEN